MTRRREESTRKVRSDKKVQFPLRFNDKSTHEAIEVLSFNTDKSFNLITNLLLEAAVKNDEIINGILAMYPPRENIIIIRRND